MDRKYQSQSLNTNDDPNINPVLKLSKSETEVLRQCQIDSFYKRCLPYSLVICSSIYYGLRKGHLSPSPRFGYVPKLISGGIFGYIMGKVSYHRVCLEKIMQLPDSNLADSIRRRQGGSLSSFDITSAPMLSEPASDDVFTSIPSQPIFDDHKPDERDRNEGLHEYNKVADSLSEYSIPDEGKPGSNVQPVVTYEERMRLNREEYQNQLNAARNSMRTEPPRPAPTLQPPASPPPVGRKNKYGDIIYDSD